MQPDHVTAVPDRLRRAHRHFRSWARHPDSEAVITELEAAKSLTPARNWYRANVPPESSLIHVVLLDLRQSQVTIR
jgi:hypothetical protein